MSGLSKTSPGAELLGAEWHRGRSKKPFSVPPHPQVDLFRFILQQPLLRSRCWTLFTAGRVSRSLKPGCCSRSAEGRHRRAMAGAFGVQFPSHPCFCTNRQPDCIPLQKKRQRESPDKQPRLPCELHPSTDSHRARTTRLGYFFLTVSPAANIKYYSPRFVVSHSVIILCELKIRSRIVS